MIEGVTSGDAAHDIRAKELKLVRHHTVIVAEKQRLRLRGHVRRLGVANRQSGMELTIPGSQSRFAIPYSLLAAFSRASAMRTAGRTAAIS
jgi:hypothetical protein